MANPGTSCFGTRNNGDWEFATSPLDCGTIVTGNDTHIIYTNYIQGKF